jgi:hypothetical protein
MYDFCGNKLGDSDFASNKSDAEGMRVPPAKHRKWLHAVEMRQVMMIMMMMRRRRIRNCLGNETTMRANGKCQQMRMGSKKSKVKIRKAAMRATKSL